jgi:hypothetical protein
MYYVALQIQMNERTYVALQIQMNVRMQHTNDNYLTYVDIRPC